MAGAILAMAGAIRFSNPPSPTSNSYWFNCGKAVTIAFYWERCKMTFYWGMQNLTLFLAIGVAMLCSVAATTISLSEVTVQMMG